MTNFNFLSKSGSQSMGHRVTTLASTVGSQEEFYVSGGNSRGAFTPADVCQTSSVRLNRFTAHRRGTMLKLLSVLVLVLTFGVGQMWGATHTIGWGNASGSTGTYSNFTANSGTVTGVVSFSCYQNSSSGVPAYNSSDKGLRVYYNSSGNGGGITLTPASGVTITAVSMLTTTTPTVKYKIGNGSLTNMSRSDKTYSATGLSVGSTSSISIQNCNTSNTQLKIQTITITYTVASSCTTKPSVGANLTNVSATASSITATIPISSIGGCNITENGLVYSTTATTPTVGGTGCTKVITDACGATAANKTITIDGLTCGTTYYIRGYATNGAGTQYTTNTKTQATSACLVDHFIDEVQSTNGYTGTGMAKSGNYSNSLPSISDKDVATSGTCEQQHYHFVGWITSAKYEGGTSIVAGDLQSPTSATGATYYAVWAKQAVSGGSSPTEYIMNSSGSLNTNWQDDQDRNNGIQSYAGKSSFQMYGETKTMNPCELTSQIRFTNITGISINVAANNANTVSLYYSADGSSWETWGNTVSVAKNTSSYTDYDFNLTNFPSGSYYICISNSTSSMYMYSVTITSGSAPTYTDYIAKCCTPLGSINGSFSFTNVSPTSVTVGVPSDYSDKDNANLEGYIFKRYAASTGGDALETIETDAANKTTATFSTGLVANTTYYYTIIAKHSSSSCNSAETSPRKSYKIDSYVVSYANGGGSGTNPGAHDLVLANGKVTLKSNTFDAPTGKEFRVWNDGTSDLDEGEEYTVTANTVMTAQWQCMEPGFTKNLSTTQVNYLQGETAAKLSVTAAANGAELSYAWEMSANGTTGWSSVGTNSNEYTPSTATAGDQYYHCIVTNLADGCTESKATSAVAHIHVDVPAACLEPVISVASDTYYEDKSVTITCGTVGAAIYYTTDGSTTPTSGSTLYEGAITVDHSMTIKAIAIKAGMDNSTVAEGTYTIKCETPTIVLAAGNYTGVQTTTITKGYGTKIYYTTDGSTPSNMNGTEYTGAVSIDQPMTIKAIVWKDGCTNSEVASAAYTLKCTTPTFNKETGTYTGVQSITLSGTAGADIYYTLDGTAPSKTNGTKYTAAIEVSANQTVKAIAVKEGWGDSEIASATYTIQYNVYWWVNGVAWIGKGGSTLVTYGQTATAPTTAPTKADGCGDKFMGWTETQNYENDNTAPMDMFTETSAAITKETNFYAVFADYGEEE